MTWQYSKTCLPFSVRVRVVKYGCRNAAQGKTRMPTEPIHSIEGADFTPIIKISRFVGK